MDIEKINTEHRLEADLIIAKFLLLNDTNKAKQFLNLMVTGNIKDLMQMYGESEVELACRKLNNIFEKYAAERDWLHSAYKSEALTPETPWVGVECREKRAVLN